MRILRAEHLGMCFGVKDAIELALATAAHQPLTILGELVHNETVLNQLRASGIQLRNEPGEVGTQTVMITAHGASQRRTSALRERDLNVLEATCPLVHAAHRAVAKLVRDGFHPVIIGKCDHVEVRGLTEDLDDFDVVLDEADVLALREHPRFGVVAQTTQPIERVLQLVALLRGRFTQSDTVCRPTKLRQHAAMDLAQQCDVVVVVGGAHSNNTRELIATCQRHCERVFHVSTAIDLRPEWFWDARVVGITAGTSTPDNVIVEVERWLSALAGRAEVPAPHRIHADREREGHLTLRAA